MNWLKLLTKTKILSVDPGDIVIINIEKRMRDGNIQDISNTLNEVLPDNVVLLLTNVGKVELSKIISKG